MPSSFAPTANRNAYDVNFENANRARENRVMASLLGRAQVGGVTTLDPAWDAFDGAYERNREDAADAGMGYRMGSFAPPRAPAIASLQRAAGGGDVGPDGDATDYQLKRAVLDRTLNDNFAAKWGQRTALSDADRARDPGVQDYEAQRRRDRASADTAAADQIAADSFRRLEPTRLLQRRENVQNSEEMLPFNAGYLQSLLKNSGTFDTNDARRDVATTNANARTGSAAMNSLARVAGAQTFGDPTADRRVQDAASAIRPNVPGAPAAPGASERVFPADALPDFAREHGMTLGQAQDYIAQVQGYTIR